MPTKYRLIEASVFIGAFAVLIMALVHIDDVGDDNAAKVARSQSCCVAVYHEGSMRLECPVESDGVRTIVYTKIK